MELLKLNDRNVTLVEEQKNQLKAFNKQIDEQVKTIIDLRVELEGSKKRQMELAQNYNVVVEETNKKLSTTKPQVSIIQQLETKIVDLEAANKQLKEHNTKV